MTGGSGAAAAVLQRNTIAAMVNVAARVIAPVYIILSLPCVKQKSQNPSRVKYWEIVADNLSRAGLELGLRLSRGFQWAANLLCRRGSLNYNAASWQAVSTRRSERG